MNKYANLVSTNKIKDEYTKINIGFDRVEADINKLETDVTAVNTRVDTIITTPISGAAATQEIVDARVSAVKAKTFASLDARFEETEQDIATHMAENVHIGKNPACMVANSISQSIPNDVLTTLTFNTELFDTDNIFDVATDNTKLICKTAGIYLIIGQALFSVAGSGERALNIGVNNISVNQVTTPAAASYTTDIVVTAIRKLAVGDYVQLRAKQNSGGALSTFIYGTLNTQFSMVRIG